MALDKIDWSVINTNVRNHLRVGKRLNLNMVQMHQNNTDLHEIAKAIVCRQLTTEGNIYCTEAMLKNGKRPDILVLDVIPPIAHEIMHSESQESIDLKRETYGDIRIITHNALEVVKEWQKKNNLM